MIALWGRDTRALLGVAAMLDLEKIPYRRVADPGRSGEDLLLAAGGDLEPADIATLERQRALVLFGGASLARHLLRANDAFARNGSVRLPLDSSVFPADVVSLARAQRETALRLPLAPVCDVRHPARGALRAKDGDGAVAVAAVGGAVWCSIDLGTAFLNLVAENTGERTPAASAPPILRRAAESAYYLLPESWRGRARRHTYAQLERDLTSRRPESIANYPADATGWLLLELLKDLIRTAAGSLVRLERWPAPFRAAAAITHDIEPRRYAYTAGLDALLRHAGAGGEPAAFGLVAESAAAHLSEEQIEATREYEVFCHGRTHRGEPVRGRREVLKNLRTARAVLERRLGRPVHGYRSPRLDRSPDLLWALDQSGFEYDSSYPDVDRENPTHYGNGVRLNLPYRPLIEDGEGLRPSRCLELPLTAPDCIQPLFAGEDDAALAATITRKTEFVRASGGCHIALVHGGVFGPEDSARRLEHLHEVRRHLRHADVWLTSIDGIAAWWRQREQLEVSACASAVTVTNTGCEAVEGVRAVVEDSRGACIIAVPPLAAGESFTSDLGRRDAVGAA